jgi:hypothetical protein
VLDAAVDAEAGASADVGNTGDTGSLELDGREAEEELERVVEEEAEEVEGAGELNAGSSVSVISIFQRSSGVACALRTKLKISATSWPS